MKATLSWEARRKSVEFCFYIFLICCCCRVAGAFSVLVVGQVLARASRRGRRFARAVPRHLQAAREGPRGDDRDARGGCLFLALGNRTIDGHCSRIGIDLVLLIVVCLRSVETALTLWFVASTV